MAHREYPVGKAQQMVLDALNMTAANHREAEHLFESLGIVVASKRQGRTSVPAITIKSRQIGGFDASGDGWSDTKYAAIDTSAIEQWIIDDQR